MHENAQSSITSNVMAAANAFLPASCSVWLCFWQGTSQVTQTSFSFHFDG